MVATEAVSSFVHPRPPPLSTTRTLLAPVALMSLIAWGVLSLYQVWAWLMPRSTMSLPLPSSTRPLATWRLPVPALGRVVVVAGNRVVEVVAGGAVVLVVAGTVVAGAPVVVVALGGQVPRLQAPKLTAASASASRRTCVRTIIPSPRTCSRPVGPAIGRATSRWTWTGTPRRYKPYASAHSTKRSPCLPWLTLRSRVRGAQGRAVSRRSTPRRRRGGCDPSTWRRTSRRRHSARARRCR